MGLKGFDVLREFYRKDFAANKGARLRNSSTRHISFADGVVTHGLFEWSLPIPGAPPVMLEGRYTVVKGMKNGRLVFVADHTSAPMRMENPDAPPREK